MTGGLPGIERIAELLGGEASGGQVLCPGPGHDTVDRSLSVKPDAADREGFVTHSFSGDDWKDCRAHVRTKLGLPEPQKKNGSGKAWTELGEYIYLDQNGERYLRVRKCRDGAGKKQFPQFHWDGTQWLKGKPAGPKIPYRLPELIAAPTAVVYFCEGEKDADNLASKACVVATSMSEGAGAKWAPELTQYFKDRRVVILPDADEPGRKHAQKVAKAIHEVAASVKVVDLFPDRSDGHDVSDWLKHDAVGAKLFAAVKAAPEWQPGDEPVAGDGKEESEISGEIARLAKLPAIKYEQERKAAAEKLGCRASVLDRLVQAERARLGLDGGKSKDPAPALYEHWNVEMADQPVDGGILLRALKEAIRRYVFASADQALVVALWIVFSWLHERCTHSPMLFVTSAERDSGKSTLLGLINFLARRALLSVEISGAALFRSITKWEPTLIVDEADDVLADNADLRSVINSGWTRGQGTIRCHPDTHEPELFSTFAPKIVAMKGRKLADTTLSRCIIITMRPRRADDPEEHAADFDHLDAESFARLRSHAMRWAADNGEAIARAVPEIPPGFHNRRRANWKPLLAIAEACGSKQDGWKAALAIEAVADTFDPSIGVELLRAIKTAFKTDRITSADLITDLVADATAPWATWNKGKPISQRQVANLLKPYGVRPKTIKLDDGSTAKGYLLEMFADAFDRFCSSGHTHTSPTPPNLSVTSVTSLISQDFSRFRSVTGSDEVTDRNASNSLKNNNGYGVTDENGGPGAARVFCAGNATEDEPDAITEDRTCAQCHGAIDGTERLVSVSGHAAWVHLECQRFWVRALNERER